MANGTLKVENIQTSSGSGTITLGQSGETITSSAAMGSGMGKVLQVVNGTTSTAVTIATTTLTATGLSASITPSSTSNKILVLVNQNGTRKEAVNNDMQVSLFRDSTEITKITGFSLYTNSTTQLYGETVSTSFLDTPSTTSSITYSTKFSRPDGSGNIHIQTGSSESTITLMEIAG